MSSSNEEPLLKAKAQVALPAVRPSCHCMLKQEPHTFASLVPSFQEGLEIYM